jgi:hypothetical protein
MLIGTDFDNTIVCYDSLFHRLALDAGFITADLAEDKGSVRDYLRRTGQERRWTELQGEVYGARMAEAGIFPGVVDFFQTCRAREIPVNIISHKSRRPYLGAGHDLHRAAQDWLAANGFYSAGGAGLRPQDVYFEESRDRKLARISHAGCTHFIDDLPEFLAEPGFPRNVDRILFDPRGVHPGTGSLTRVGSWNELAMLLLGER